MRNKYSDIMTNTIIIILGANQDLTQEHQVPHTMATEVMVGMEVTVDMEMIDALVEEVETEILKRAIKIKMTTMDIMVITLTDTVAMEVGVDLIHGMTVEESQTTIMIDQK